MSMVIFLRLKTQLLVAFFEAANMSKNLFGDSKIRMKITGFKYKYLATPF